MGSRPIDINFSCSKGTILQTIMRIEELVCNRWNCGISGFGRMRASDNPYEGGYEVYDYDPIPCSEIGEIADLVQGKDPFALVYYARDISSHHIEDFDVHFTEIDDTGHTVFVDSTTSRMLQHRDDDHPIAGEWFEAWLISIVAAVDAAVCACGNVSGNVVWENISPEAPRESESWEVRRSRLDAWLRRRIYDALDPRAILHDLREGRLLECPDQVFHAIRYDLISPVEIERLMDERPKAERLIYKVVSGYHVLSNIVCP